MEITKVVCPICTSQNFTHKSGYPNPTIKHICTKCGYVVTQISGTDIIQGEPDYEPEERKGLYELL